MTWFNGAFVPGVGTCAVVAISAVVFAAVFHDAKQAPRALKRAYRRIRFHWGPIHAEVAPLTPSEAAALTVIRQRYRKWAHEPECPHHQEDRS